MQHLKEYTPIFTGIMLIAFGLFIPLGFSGSPRLIDFFSYWASSLINKMI